MSRSSLCRFLGDLMSISLGLHIIRWRLLDESCRQALPFGGDEFAGKECVMHNVHMSDNNVGGDFNVVEITQNSFLGEMSDNALMRQAAMYKKRLRQIQSYRFIGFLIAVAIGVTWGTVAYQLYMRYGLVDYWSYWEAACTAVAVTSSMFAKELAKPGEVEVALRARLREARIELQIRGAGNSHRG